MENLFEFLLKSGLQPLKFIPELSELEKLVNRSEVVALLMLRFYDEMTMSELAVKLGSPLSTVTSLSKRLVRKGLIERYRSSKDKRIILIKLTNDGQKIAERAKEIIQKILVNVQKALSQDELNQFIHLALKVVKALQRNDETGKKVPNVPFRRVPIDD